MLEQFVYPEFLRRPQFIVGVSGLTPKTKEFYYTIWDALNDYSVSNGKLEFREFDACHDFSVKENSNKGKLCFKQRWAAKHIFTMPSVILFFIDVGEDPAELCNIFDICKLRIPAILATFAGRLPVIKVYLVHSLLNKNALSTKEIQRLSQDVEVPLCNIISVDLMDNNYICSVINSLHDLFSLADQFFSRELISLKYRKDHSMESSSKSGTLKFYNKLGFIYHLKGDHLLAEKNFSMCFNSLARYRISENVDEYNMWVTSVCYLIYNQAELSGKADTAVSQLFALIDLIGSPVCHADDNQMYLWIASNFFYVGDVIERCYKRFPTLPSKENPGFYYIEGCRLLLKSSLKVNHKASLNCYLEKSMHYLQNYPRFLTVIELYYSQAALIEDSSVLIESKVIDMAIRLQQVFWKPLSIEIISLLLSDAISHQVFVQYCTAVFQLAMFEDSESCFGNKLLKVLLSGTDDFVENTKGLLIEKGLFVDPGSNAELYSEKPEKMEIAMNFILPFVSVSYRFDKKVFSIELPICGKLRIKSNVHVPLEIRSISVSPSFHATTPKINGLVNNRLIVLPNEFVDLDFSFYLYGQILDAEPALVILKKIEMEMLIQGVPACFIWDNDAFSLSAPSIRKSSGFLNEWGFEGLNTKYCEMSPTVCRLTESANGIAVSLEAGGVVTERSSLMQFFSYVNQKIKISLKNLEKTNLTNISVSCFGVNSEGFRIEGIHFKSFVSKDSDKCSIPSFPAGGSQDVMFKLCSSFVGLAQVVVEVGYTLEILDEEGCFVSCVNLVQNKCFDVSFVSSMELSFLLLTTEGVSQKTWGRKNLIRVKIDSKLKNQQLTISKCEMILPDYIEVSPVHVVPQALNYNESLVFLYRSELFDMQDITFDERPFSGNALFTLHACCCGDENACDELPITFSMPNWNIHVFPILLEVKVQPNIQCGQINFLTYRTLNQSTCTVEVDFEIENKKGELLSEQLRNNVTLEPNKTNMFTLQTRYFNKGMTTLPRFTKFVVSKIVVDSERYGSNRSTRYNYLEVYNKIVSKNIMVQ